MRMPNVLEQFSSIRWLVVSSLLPLHPSRFFNEVPIQDFVVSWTNCEACLVGGFLEGNYFPFFLFLVEVVNSIFHFSITLLNVIFWKSSSTIVLNIKNTI